LKPRPYSRLDLFGRNTVALSCPTCDKSGAVQKETRISCIVRHTAFAVFLVAQLKHELQSKLYGSGSPNLIKRTERSVSNIPELSRTTEALPKHELRVPKLRVKGAWASNVANWWAKVRMV